MPIKAGIWHASVKQGAFRRCTDLDVIEATTTALLMATWISGHIPCTRFERRHGQ